MTPRRWLGITTPDWCISSEAPRAWHTPASVHYGTSGAIDDARAVTLNRAFAQHPERFAKRPRPPRTRSEVVWINKPHQEVLPIAATTKTT